MKLIIAFFALSFTLIQISVTELLPDKGYWNCLPRYGLAGRIVHYLVADSEAFGNEVTKLNEYFSEKYEPKNYQNLERQVVLSVPISEFEQRLFKIAMSLFAVKDPKTNKTLGDAFIILYNLLTNPQVNRQVEERLDLKDPRMIALDVPAGNDFNLHEILKNTIIENPEAIINVLQDPQVVNFVSSAVLQYLSSDKVDDGIKSLQDLVLMMEIAYTKVLEDHGNPLLSITDEESGISLAQTLMALANIIETSDFAQELKNLLNPTAVGTIHQRTQQMFVQNKPTITGKEISNLFRIIGINVSAKDGDSILQLYNERQLTPKMINLLTEIDKESNLSPQKISDFITDQGYQVSPSSVSTVLELLSNIKAENVQEMLEQSGISIPPRKVKTIIGLLNNIKVKCDQNQNKVMPSVEITKKDESAAPIDTESNPPTFGLIDETLASAIDAESKSEINPPPGSEPVVPFEPNTQMPKDLFKAINDGEGMIRNESEIKDAPNASTES